jgi:hypothetical protein
VKRRQSFITLVVVMSLLPACAEGSHAAERGERVALGDAGTMPIGEPDAASPCTSGTMRGANESEGPEMLPGRACNACHAQSNAASGEGDAPIFAFAGTLFTAAYEPDNCIAPAAQGAHVIVTDASGAVFDAVANASGNFLLESDEFVLPLRARVVIDGRERPMLEAQMSGDCNRCHTAPGREGAPGRILLPQ